MDEENKTKNIPDEVTEDEIDVLDELTQETEATITPQTLMKDYWRTDRPKKPGLYLTVTLFPDINGDESIAEVQIRYLGRAVEQPKQWRLWNEPQDGLVWTTNDQRINGHVYAWMPIPDYPDLPEGVVGVPMVDDE